MEAIDYVKLFKLDQENYDFKREEFISELGKEFLDYCQTTTIGINPKTHKLYYYRFKEIIKNFESKFWAISKLKVGEGFTQNLWNAFFATQVVPLRAKMFPDIQQFIEKRKKEYLNEQDKKQSTYKKGSHGKGDKLIFTRDYASGDSFNLAVKKKTYKAYFYNLSINCYVCYKLELVGYDESKDIRKAYLYGKRR